MGIILGLWLVWPGLSFAARVFPRHYFGFWSAIAIILAFIAALVNIFLPLYEARDVYKKVPSVLLDVFRKDKLHDIPGKGQANGSK